MQLLEFEPSAEMIATPAGDDPSRFIERARERIRSEGYWVVRGDGNGVRLYMGGRPLGVSYGFDELESLARNRMASREVERQHIERSTPGLR